MKSVSIHQPEFLPWNGFFYKLANSDVFILYDLAQYNKQDFQNRNRFRCDDQSKVIGVTLKKFHHNILMKNVKIASETKWEVDFRNKIRQYYRNESYFSEIYQLLSIIWEKQWVYLSELNIEMIKLIVEYLELDTKIALSSDLISDEEEFRNFDASMKNLILCKNVNASRYISGMYGKNYLNENLFYNNGIEVEYIGYNTEDAINYSIVDSLFRHGKDTKLKIL